MQVAFLSQCRKRDSEAEGVGANVVSVAVLVKKEVHESELLFLASAYQKGAVSSSPAEAGELSHGTFH